MKIKKMFILGALICTSSAVLASSAPIITTQPKSQTVNEGSYSNAILCYRYGFDSTYEKQGRLMSPDSISGADATLYGSAKIQNGYLSLDGTGDRGSFTDGCFAALPANIMSGFSSYSIEMWVKCTGDQGSWMRLFDFGNCSGGEYIGEGHNYTMMTWRSGNSTLRSGVRLYWDGDTQYREDVVDAEMLPIGDNVFHHIVYTYDSKTQTGKIYTDGAIAGSGSQEFNPTQFGDMPNMWLGKAEFGDPYFQGNYDEFRIYQGVLSADEVKNNYVKGPEVFDGGESLPPIITTQPMSQSVIEGRSVTFSVTTTGTTPLSYQWYKGSSKISGATKSSYTISSVKSSDAGSYAVTVSNSFGNVTSSAAILKVLEPGTYANAVLYYRYGFDTAYENQGRLMSPDSISGADATLYGSARIQNGYLSLDGTGDQSSFTDGCFAALPPEIIADFTSFTVEMWARASSEGNWDCNWMRLFDFGNCSIYEDGRIDSGKNYTTMTWKAGDYMRACARLNGVEQRVEAPVLPIGDGKFHHIVYVYDDQKKMGTIYSDGIQTGQGYQEFNPTQWGGCPNMWIGKSQFSADPYFVGDFNEFRIYEGTLSADEVKSNYVLGPDVSGGESIPPTITTQPKSQTVNEGSSVTFSVVAGGTAPLSYQWYKDGRAISDASTSKYTIKSVKISDAGSYTVTVSNSVGSVTSSAATLTVNVPVTLSSITINGNSSVNVGSTATYTCTATYSNGTTKTVTPTWAISAGSSYASITSGGVLTGKAAGTATIQARYGEGSVTKTVTKNVTVNAVVVKPSITTQPKSQTVNEGSSVTFSVTATGTTPLSYQWKKNGSNISGATGSSYTISSVKTSDAGSYTVTVSNSAGSVTSSAATLTVTAKPTITTQPKNQTVYEGSSVTFSVTATGTGLSYQWYKGSSKISGATKASYTISSAMSSDEGAYYVVVSNTAGNATSSTATLTVNTKPIGTGATINMVSYNTVTYGSSCGSLAGTKVGNEIWGVLLYNGQVVAVEAFAANSSGAPTGKLKGNVIGTDMVPVGTDVIFQLAAYDQGYIDHPSTGNYYYGISAPFTYHTGDSSNPMVLPDMYLAFDSFTIEWVTKPTITTQPKSQTVTEGNSVTFSVTATGTTPLTYQWKKNGSNISGATKSSYTISSTKTSDAGSYTVTVSNSAGSVTSSAATLTVTAKPAITTQPKSQTVNEGSSVTFSVVATGSGLTYQWKKNGSNISGATKSSYTISSAKTSDAGSYTVTVSNSAGSVTSSAATLTVNSSPVSNSSAVRSVKRNGKSATVTLQLNPDSDVSVMFVEEHVPSGVTISVNNGGTYVASRNMIRWSFLDGNPRDISYVLTVADDFFGKVSLNGEVTFDETTVAITGTSEIDFAILTHPADMDDDFEISTKEISSYALAWTKAQSWSREPADIPVTYVSRAAIIWVNGGYYDYDPSKTEPSCWVSTNVKPASVELASDSVNVRTINVLEGKADVSLEVIPASGISVYFVEEQLPADVTLNVTDISDGGNYIPEKNVIRWSFLDGTPRTLTYTLEPEEGFVGKVLLNGEVTFDEETFTTEGDTEAVFRPILNFVMEDDGKTLILNFTGTLYESEDTVTWTEVEGAESPFIVDTTKGKKFYRCVK